MIPIKLKIILSIVMIIEKEALKNPNLIRLGSNITILKVNNNNNTNENLFGSNLTSDKTSLSLYVPKFVILKASSLNSNYNLNLNTSNPLCRQTYSFSNFENYVSKRILIKHTLNFIDRAKL